MQEMSFELNDRDGNYLDTIQWNDCLELNRNQVEQLIPVLQFWLTNRELPPQE